jgi:hypothetical protein
MSTALSLSCDHVHMQLQQQSCAIVATVTAKLGTFSLPEPRKGLHANQGRCIDRHIHMRAYPRKIPHFPFRSAPAGFASKHKCTEYLARKSRHHLHRRQPSETHHPPTATGRLPRAHGAPTEPHGPISCDKRIHVTPCRYGVAARQRVILLDISWGKNNMQQCTKRKHHA